ncbi:MAG: hypothetical protein ACRC6V_03670 [Bacteroidales bacterium]
MIDELNTLIEKEMPGLPDFRSTVSNSGSNLAWLRKAVKRYTVSDRLLYLLSLEINELKSF